LEPNQAVLVMMFKRPLPGQGKQRLAAGIGKEAAYQLACDLFTISGELLAEWPGRSIASPADRKDADWAKQKLSEHVEILAQGEGNLGERINLLDQQLRAAGSQQVLFIGSDAPELSLGLLSQVVQALRQHDIALVPSSDGGVSLMAGRKPWPALADLPWSTPELGAAIRERCIQNGLSVATVSHCDDLDELVDLRQLLQRWQDAELTPSQERFRQAAKQILESIDGTDS